MKDRRNIKNWLKSSAYLFHLWVYFWTLCFSKVQTLEHENLAFEQEYSQFFTWNLSSSRAWNLRKVHWIIQTCFLFIKSWDSIRWLFNWCIIYTETCFPMWRHTVCVCLFCLFVYFTVLLYIRILIFMLKIKDIIYHELCYNFDCHQLS